MPNPIVVENVSKRYQLGDAHDGALKQKLESMVRAPGRKLRGRDPADDVPDPRDAREFWALKGVSLEVEPGEVLGLIGANGAGKSTLLKILSRITLPTGGKITMRGRVGSLLEVGTGFHPELSGSDNIYLNGSILGMRRREIDKIYDEIVEFSGIEKFINTPVKRYSSGMYVRLAFSVAAHLRTDVLLIDEVLSVGDADFQRKSLGKMDAAASEGRTVVFVSHSLASVQRLCHRALWIADGKVAADGSVTEVIGDYLEGIGPGQDQGTATIEDDILRLGEGAARVRRVTVIDGEGQSADRIPFGDPLKVSLELELRKPLDSIVTELGISSADGARVITSYNTDGGNAPFSLPAGRHEMLVEVDTSLLPGEFSVDFGIHEPGGLTHDYVERLINFRVVNPPEGDPGRYPWKTVRGSVLGGSGWSVMPSAVEAGDATASPAP